jgi:hypothetical protein
MGSDNSIISPPFFCNIQTIRGFFSSLSWNVLLLWLAGFFCFMSLGAKGQFLNGYGLSAGLLYGNHRTLVNLDPAYSKNMKWRWGWHASAFIEYGGGEYLRWQTEAQWFRSGAYSTWWHERVPTRHLVLGQYLKLRQELYDITPYALIGPRLEYLISSGYPGFRQIHFGAFAALGIEFLYRRPWIWFVEAGRTQDFTASYKSDPVSVYSKTWMLRIGIKREIAKKGKSCRSGGLRPTFD